MTDEKNPPSAEITMLYCTVCGSYIRRDELCTYQCPQYGVFIYDRPKGAVKNAVYRLAEKKDVP